MLNWIIGFSLKNRMFVLMMALMVAGYGLYTSTRMPIDVLPDLNRPTVTIMTEVHGMTPEDVERRVTRPLEQALNGATGVARVRSDSGKGLSIVYVEFGWDTDIWRDRVIVQEKLQLAQSKLPPEAKAEMSPMSSIMGQIQLIGIQSSSGETELSKVRALCDQTIRPRLLSIAGIAQIVTVGGAPRQLQITVDSEKLRVFDVTLNEVADAIKDANVNASGGTMTVGVRGPVVTVTGRINHESQIANAMVKNDPVRPVRISDVARVEFGPAAIRAGEAGVNAKDGVIMVITKQPDVDTVKLTNAINAELVDLKATLPKDLVITNDLFQQAAFIHRAIDNVMAAVRDGGILVIVILFLFLLNLRTTFITLTAIPLSVAITAIVFAAFGLSINTMTLGGLAVAIGALVDDAIVDVENVFRRLRQNASFPTPRSTLWVIFKASSEVRNPILIGTLLVVVVYLPLFFLQGMEGRLFAPIGVAYIISTLASLVVSLTVTPALCYYLLGARAMKGHEKDGLLVRMLKPVAAAMIRFSIAFPVPILLLLFCSTVIAGVMLFTQGSQFLPAFNEGTAQVNLILPPGTSLATSDAFGKRLDNLLSDVKGVKNIARRAGRAEGDEHAMDVNFNEVIVTFDPSVKRSREEIIEEIRKRMEVEFPNMPSSVEQPLSHMLSHTLSGVNAQVAIKVYGPNLEVLRRTAAEIEAAVKPISGVQDLYAEPQVLIDQVEIKPKRDALINSGLTVKGLAETIDLAGGAEQVSEMMVGQIAYPIVVRLEEKNRQSIDDLRSLHLRTTDGRSVLLSDVADVDITKTPNTISAENVSRRIVVQHNIGGTRSLGEVVGDVKKAIQPIKDKLAATPGYSIRISGQFEAQEEATRLLLILSGISLLAMFLILYTHFGSINLSLQVMTSIPMAFVGAVTYIVLSKQTLSVATMVGLISLGGIAARNAILLLDHYLHLMREENEPFGEAMIVRAGQERMVPVLMTALCSGIALVPLALSPNEPGRELLYPVATVIIGGLISSTILDFLVTPGLFWLIGKRDSERLAKTAHRPDRTAEALAEEFNEPSTQTTVAATTAHSEELSHA